MKVSFLVPLALFAALAGLLYTGLQRNPGVVSSPLVGRPLPAGKIGNHRKIVFPQHFRQALGSSQG